MIISGFGGKNGSLSSRSTGIKEETDGFLSIVRSIAGGDLLFCFDPSTIGGIAVGNEVTEWRDALGAYDTYFANIGTDGPSFGTYNGEPVLNFDGSSTGLRTQEVDTQLLGKKDLSLLLFTKTNAGSTFQAILEFSNLWYRHGAFTISEQRDSSDFSGYFAQSNNISQLNVSCPAGANGTNVDVDLPLVRGVVFNRNGAGGGGATTTRPYINGIAIPADIIYDGGGTTYNIDAPFAQINPATGDYMYFYLSNRADDFHYNGSIGTIVAITRALTDSEMDKLSKAILRKYNLDASAPIK
jgi:hypothetical protein